jgi:hypothetical protein
MQTAVSILLQMEWPKKQAIQNRLESCEQEFQSFFKWNGLKNDLKAMPIRPITTRFNPSSNGMA